MKKGTVIKLLVVLVLFGIFAFLFWGLKEISTLKPGDIGMRICTKNYIPEDETPFLLKFYGMHGSNGVFRIDKVVDDNFCSAYYYYKNLIPSHGGSVTTFNVIADAIPKKVDLVADYVKHRTEGEPEPYSTPTVFSNTNGGNRYLVIWNGSDGSKAPLSEIK